jgi:hypothetical protein
MNTQRSDDVIRSTVGLNTDLTHQGHIGRLSILGKSRRSDVRWKLSGWKCNVKRPKLRINCHISSNFIAGMNNCRTYDLIRSTVDLHTDVTHTPGA